VVPTRPIDEEKKGRQAGSAENRRVKRNYNRLMQSEGNQAENGGKDARLMGKGAREGITSDSCRMEYEP